MRLLRVGLAQINTTVGDFDGNRARILDAARRAAALDADIVAFPELAVTGYPPEDLLLRAPFIDEAEAALAALARDAEGLPPLVVGCVEFDGVLYNSAAIVHEGAIAARYRKHRLPNYGVFDEQRYFHPGRGTPRFLIGGVEVAVTVCEDIWYADGPAHDAALDGAEVIVNINASAVPRGQDARARAHARHPSHRLPGRDRVREPGRRAGRVGLRRQLAGHRRAWGGARAWRLDARRPRRRRHPGRRGAAGAAPRVAAASRAPRRRARGPAAHHRRLRHRPLAAAADGPRTARRPRRDLRRARGRRPRLHAEDRLRGHDRRALGRHRLLARRSGSRRRARAGTRARRLAALALLLGGLDRGRAGSRGPARQSS